MNSDSASAANRLLPGGYVILSRTMAHASETLPDRDLYEEIGYTTVCA